MRAFCHTTALVLFSLLIATGLQAQAAVTAGDLTRLETAAADVERLLGALDKKDKTLAADVRGSLQEATEEVAYLKVKLRREGRVTREEYASLRDRIETLRVRAEGGAPAVAETAPQSEKGILVPVGTEFDVKLQTPLNSGRAKVEQRFEATSIEDVPVGRTVAIPAGSIVRGFVSSVRPAGRIERRGSLTLSFDELRIDERSVRLRASVVKALDPKVSEDATRIGAGAVVGGIVGGILGGGKGAVLGVLIGGGGTIAATEGSDVDLPLGTILRIRVDQPLELFVK